MGSHGGFGESKDFLILVKSIGETRSKVEEDRIILRKIETLKRQITEPDIPKRKMKEFIIRLVYVEMLGHDASFGYIHVVKMTHDDNLLLKRTGFLAVTLFLNEDHDLIILIVVELLGHPKEAVRKKAVMALHRFYQRSPSFVAHLVSNFRKVCAGFALYMDGKALPEGPVVISPDGLFPSLFREVIRRAPHEFKIACLEVGSCHLYYTDCNPFYAGFGNRDTDEFSYLKVGIPKGKIFIINPKLEDTKTMESETNSIDRAVANLMFSKVDSGGIDLLAAVSSKEEAKGTTKQCNYSLNQPQQPHWHHHIRSSTGDAEVPIFG
ncbi:hypothetical protein TEA_020017 [Camellia sinensis var. sinensis]|uniref:LNS2/PITP domain-containing protein n=1 Tax=Camellia sinensis var. sinensis TaxID=542762 RepID=A0A4S4EPF7_CAMSN|nr:hypothetical protein TEA_020017 [Camellia sinensis var. sinensis]